MVPVCRFPLWRVVTFAAMAVVCIAFTGATHAADPLGPGGADSKESEVPPAQLARLITAANTMIQQDPTNAQAYLMRASAFMLQKKYPQSLTDADQAIKLNPKLAQAHLVRATVHHRQQKPEEALQDATRATQADPDFAPAFVMRGGILASQEKYTEAAEDFSKAIKLSPGETRVLVMRSTCYRHMRRYDDALKDVTQVLTAEPANIFALQARAACLTEMRRFNAALEDLNELVRLEPDNIAGLVQRAFVYGKSAEFEKEHTDLQRALELKPNDASVQNNLAWALATCPEEMLRDGRKAVQLATKACEANQWKSPLTIDTLAACHAEAGDFDKAVEMQQKAMDLAEAAAKARYAVRLELYRRKEAFHEPATGTESVPEERPQK